MVSSGSATPSPSDYELCSPAPYGLKMRSGDEEWLRPDQWLMRGGRRVLISEMDDSHVVNAVLLLERSDGFREARFLQYVGLVAEVERRGLHVELEVARVKATELMSFNDVVAVAGEVEVTDDLLSLIRFDG